MTDHLSSAAASSRIVIIGGGTAGIITARLLTRAGVRNISVVEPSEQHFYQPLWTLVGGGAADPNSSVRREAGLIPRGVRWIRDRVTEIDPVRQRVSGESGTTIDYDALIVALGIQLNFDALPGLREAVERGQASTNYRFDLAPKTWNLIRNFKGGVALFHMPSAPIKCPGAPQKILYLAADYFRRHGLQDQVKLIYGSGTGVIFGAPQYAAPLNATLQKYGVDARFQHELVEIKPATREAIFQIKAGERAGERVSIVYDMLHAVPPQSAPDFIRRGPLAITEGPLTGWVKADQYTLQHPDYPNIFALGDVAGTPNSKTGAAASKQALVVAVNVLAMLEGRAHEARYNGYIACPVVTGYGRMLLCEVDYSGQPAPSVPYGDPFRPRYDMWLLKKYGLPWLYWNVLLKGRKLPWVGQHQQAPDTAKATAA